MSRDVIFQEEKLRSNQIKQVPDADNDIDLNLQLQPNFFRQYSGAQTTGTPNIPI
jgi:hypothetical protein